jgi:hypothetical protein
LAYIVFGSKSFSIPAATRYVQHSISRVARICDFVIENRGEVWGELFDALEIRLLD